MNPETVFTLTEAILASTLAVVLVIILRKPLRYAVGARAAYWIWMLVPASAFILFLPADSNPVYASKALLSAPVRSAVSGAFLAINGANSATDATMLLPALWGCGVLVAAAIILHRYLTFVRSLGTLSEQPDGSLRAARCSDPVLLGVLRPRVVLPEDFGTRYDETERAMILAHELTHLARRDTQINAAAAAWLCLLWFNPLMYWAARLFRFDQEMACDAAVLEKSDITPRRYADALFKTQLAADVARHRSALGCHWHSAHPLKERIAMLKRPLPRGVRRNAGVALTFAVIVLGCYAVKTTQAEMPLPQGQGPLIALNVRWLFNGVAAPIMGGVSNNALLRNGNILYQGFKSPEYGGNAFQCTVNAGDGTDTYYPQHVAGTFLISCKLFNGDKVFATPTVLTHDGVTATIKSSTPTGLVTTLEFNPSTSEARVAAARQSIEDEARSQDATALKDMQKKFELQKETAQ